MSVVKDIFMSQAFGGGGGGGGTLQSKTVSPTTSEQNVTPDTGYDGLSSVKVNAISPTKSAETYTPTTSDQTISSGRWLSGAQTIKGDANLVAGNIKKDVEIFGVTGSYEGGGGSSYKLLASKEIEVSTTSTSAVSVGTVTAEGAYTKDNIIYVRIRRKDGVITNGTWIGSDSFYINYSAGNGDTSAFSGVIKYTVCKDAYGDYDGTSTNYGVYPTSIASDGTVSLSARYNSNYGPLNTTYVVEVYALDWPDKVSPFA